MCKELPLSILFHERSIDVAAACASPIGAAVAAPASVSSVSSSAGLVSRILLRFGLYRPRPHLRLLSSFRDCVNAAEGSTEGMKMSTLGSEPGDGSATVAGGSARNKREGASDGLPVADAFRMV